ncbi:MAG: glycoside hydrolase family 3 C-terminal domain-containing protein [Clostridiales bacterium]|nr:glycoside hydrolase family 3 C-terminal domain-containing protein [Clostridiales bacterium]
MTRETARKKAKELVSKMTLSEKAGQLLFNAPAIPRLGINEYNWWNEALHGVARSDTATVFPQAIGLAATFDSELIYDVSSAISEEGRAKYNESVKLGDRGQYRGLTYWSPNINIFRDPRWGRGQETYGEDPFLTGEIGDAFVRGLQGDGEFLKSAACAKHYAVHSGPEKLRHAFDAVCSKRDLNETYLPAFKRLVTESKVEGVMGAYNRTNGEPCCAHSELMGKILFDEWGFEGYFVSDCGAICDFHKNHCITPDGAHSAALAVKQGCDLNCGSAYSNILKAVDLGLITEDEVAERAVNLFTTRFMLGEFEDKRPYSDIPFEAVDSEKNKELNIKAAEESIVLLKNNGILPLDKSKISSVAVIGPNARSDVALRGNYHGEASQYVRIIDGIRFAVPNAKINYAEGTNIIGFDPTVSAAAVAAKHSDVSVVCLGLDETVEGEESGVESEYFDHGDRRKISLPEIQEKLLKAVCDTSNNVIVVILAGSAIDIGDELREKVAAELVAWYPGAEGGTALSNIIFGDVSPSGRLPVTFYRNDEKLPDFTDYSMDGRTYRFFKGVPAYPFGFGLSYSDFDYTDARVTDINDDTITLSVDVKNVGKFDSREVTEVYAKFSDSRYRTPEFQLCAIKSAFIKAGDTASLTLKVDRSFIKAFDDDGRRVEPDGEISLFIGGYQPDSRSEALTEKKCIKIKI